MLDIQRILHRFSSRRHQDLETWSFHRDRTPFLWSTFSRWNTLRYAQIRHLEPTLTLVLDDFYAPLEAFRLYARTTEDMPEALMDVYDQTLQTLKERGERALEALQ